MPFFSQVQHQEDFSMIKSWHAGPPLLLLLLGETLQLAFMNFLCTVQKLQRNAEIFLVFILSTIISVFPD